jgi:hypothetical protein
VIDVVDVIVVMPSSININGAHLVLSTTSNQHEATVSVYYNESYYSYFLRYFYVFCVYQDLGAVARS